MTTEHDKLLKENKDKKEKVKNITGVEKPKSRHLVGRKQINHGFHKSKVYKFSTIQILLNVKAKLKLSVYKLITFGLKQYQLF